MKRSQWILGLVSVSAVSLASATLATISDTNADPVAGVDPTQQLTPFSTLHLNKFGTNFLSSVRSH